MRILSRHLTLGTAFISLAVIFAVYSYIYASADKATFYLKDIYGSRAELDDITVSGILQDRYHRLIFKLEKGKAETHTEYNQHYKDIITVQNNLSIDEISNGTAYRLRLYSNNNNVEAEITSNNAQKHSYGSIVFTTGVIAEESSLSLTNEYKYAMAEIGDKLYFTIPTTAEYTGANGIYEVIKFANNNTGYTTKDYETQDYVRTLNTFSLNGNKSGGPAIEVLGLEAVGQKLALILSIDGKLVIRSYDAKSGDMLGEISIDDFMLVGSLQKQDGYIKKAYYTNYEAFADNEMLNLCFRSNTSTQDVDEFTILSLDFSNGVALKNKIDERFTDGNPERFYDIAEKNGKLYTAVLLREREGTGTNVIRYDVMQPEKLFIYVYDTSHLSYKGEIITDMDDDMALERQKNIVGAFEYDPLQYRSFAYIKLR